MKVTATWIYTKTPWLSSVLEKAGIRGRKMVSFCVKTKDVDLSPPAMDCMTRFTSVGHLGGPSAAHFAGSYDTAANNPQELIGEGINGKDVNPGFFYAQLDVSEYYNIRQLTVWLNPTDYANCTLEMRNKALCV